MSCTFEAPSLCNLAFGAVAVGFLAYYITKRGTSHPCNPAVRKDESKVVDRVTVAHVSELIAGSAKKQVCYCRSVLSVELISALTLSIFLFTSGAGAQRSGRFAMVRTALITARRATTPDPLLLRLSECYTD